jgi:hypothetical protein
VTTWLNTPIQMQFRVIDGLSVRFAQSQDRDVHALLLSPWPESLLAFEPIWARLAEHARLAGSDTTSFESTWCPTPASSDNSTPPPLPTSAAQKKAPNMPNTTGKRGAVVAEDEARFELRCTACGYGVIVRIVPDTCPMCRGSVWERPRHIPNERTDPT